MWRPSIVLVSTCNMQHVNVGRCELRRIPLPVKPIVWQYGILCKAHRIQLHLSTPLASCLCLSSAGMDVKRLTGSLVSGVMCSLSGLGFAPIRRLRAFGNDYYQSTYTMMTVVRVPNQARNQVARFVSLPLMRTMWQYEYSINTSIHILIQ